MNSKSVDNPSPSLIHCHGQHPNKQIMAMMKILKEFKEFAVKGNAVDMAAGIIIGGAFGKIVSSLVADIIMPPIGVLLGGAEFKDLAIVLQSAVAAVPATETSPGIAAIPPVAIRYGQFFQTVLDFLIVALSVFVMVKAANKMSNLRLNRWAGIPTAEEKQEDAKK